MTGFDAVVLAGGAARRLGGADKPGLDVGGTPLLDRVLAACAQAATTVVVGPERPTARPVRWAREQPPGGGPVAAVAAGLGPVTAEFVLLLAADLPFFGTPSAARLLRTLAESPGTAAAMLVDADGRDQPLAAAYRTGALRGALARLPADPSGLPLRRLVGDLPTRRLADPDDASADCDTWADVAAARDRARSHTADRAR
jgi:molybdopterin-guanine dinucleotide biosynthesis protein A